MRKQVTDSVLLVRPSVFRKNEQTAVNNFFQRDIENLSGEEVNREAQGEFDALVNELKSHGILVTVIQDDEKSESPDSIFPNNIVSFHQDGKIIFYPMFAPNRRKEHLLDFEGPLKQNGYYVKLIKDLSEAENNRQYLEGTGALVLDRTHRIAYCALSERADRAMLDEYCRTENYTPIVFHAFQTVNGERRPIYHTNVVLAVGEDFAILCPSAIDHQSERDTLIKKLKQTGKEIIEINENQLENFAANCLQVRNKYGNRFIVLSDKALSSLTLYQTAQLEKHGKIIHQDLHVIETCGGGSVRHMMAEVFLPKEKMMNA